MDLSGYRPWRGVESRLGRAPGDVAYRRWLLASFGLLAAVYLLDLGRRSRTAPGSRIRRALAVLAYGLRLSALAAAIGFVVSLAPDAVPLLGLGLLALFLVLVVAGRDLFRDGVAWMVVGLERRVRPGAWLRSGDIAGRVESTGLRSTILVDDTGRSIVLPNRRLLEDVAVSPPGRWPERSFALRLEGVDATWSSDEVRRAILDAVLAAPWVPAGVRPSVARDSEHPSRWWVRTPLLAVHFGPLLEGDIADRVRDRMAQNPSSGRSDLGSPST